jgi:RNA recognition motif-containing protein
VDSSDVENPGNNLYVTGLSSRITDRDLEKHFSTEGEVIDASIVLDPWTRESRGFGFVTMATLKEAERCIKYLDRSVLEGRVITVEKVFSQDRYSDIFQFPFYMTWILYVSISLLS